MAHTSLWRCSLSPRAALEHKVVIEARGIQKDQKHHKSGVNLWIWVMSSHLFFTNVVTAVRGDLQPQPRPTPDEHARCSWGWGWHGAYIVALRLSGGGASFRCCSPADRGVLMSSRSPQRSSVHVSDSPNFPAASCTTVFRANHPMSLPTPISFLVNGTPEARLDLGNAQRLKSNSLISALRYGLDSARRVDLPARLHIQMSLFVIMVEMTEKARLIPLGFLRLGKKDPKSSSENLPDAGLGIVSQYILRWYTKHCMTGCLTRHEVHRTPPQPDRSRRLLRSGICGWSLDPLLNGNWDRDLERRREVLRESRFRTVPHHKCPRYSRWQVSINPAPARVRARGVRRWILSSIGLGCGNWYVGRAPVWETTGEVEESRIDTRSGIPSAEKMGAAPSLVVDGDGAAYIFPPPSTLPHPPRHRHLPAYRLRRHELIIAGFNTLGPCTCERGSGSVGQAEDTGRGYGRRLLYGLVNSESERGGVARSRTSPTMDSPRLATRRFKCRQTDHTGVHRTLGSCARGLLLTAIPERQRVRAATAPCTVVAPRSSEYGWPAQISLGWERRYERDGDGDGQAYADSSSVAAVRADGSGEILGSCDVVYRRCLRWPPTRRSRPSSVDRIQLHIAPLGP
ncbi:hypothetical protein C8R45DRAFT_1103608 [Mycena sanguinolenta]|nr:hypothetical protein C8R45DRAFT_1103608 [Mycena sanguinolenta]